MEKIVQTAGRNTLGEFAPEFAHFNDDVLFGENWNNQDIDVKTRSIITVVALMASGITDSSLRYHLQNAKNHGVVTLWVAEIIGRHRLVTAFYLSGLDVESTAVKITDERVGYALYHPLFPVRGGRLAQNG